MKRRGLLSRVRIGRVLLPVATLALLPSRARPVVASSQMDIVGPPGSGSFGAAVVALPNGNIVVTDPTYDDGPAADVGAAYLYDGATGELVSALTGRTPGDQVGSGGVIVLANGNFVVLSPLWDNGPAVDAGAATWGNSATGRGGAVSAANSLVGGTAGDQVGSDGVIGLNSGNYVVISTLWDNGTAADAGAVTWGNGLTGASGVVKPDNSLVGSTAGDQVGYWGVKALDNGNYVVISLPWDNGAAVNAGAVTWADGTAGIAGPVSPANSLVGSTTGDAVGYPDVWSLTNGNYVVSSRFWDNGPVVNAGAVTWGNGTTGVTGPVAQGNSLVGRTADDLIGDWVTPLSNGNYVVRSKLWDNGAVPDVGAVTWGSGTSGIVGPVSPANSLVGSTAYDYAGDWVAALANGSYVVSSVLWDNGAAVDAGAATWGDGTTGIVGTISPANSLVGSTAGDMVGHWVLALSNGNYVVGSRYWDNGEVVDAGAATWGDGNSGVAGPVSPANSLVGSTDEDDVSLFMLALSNGNYVVGTPWWDNGAAVDAGAATWGNGTDGTVGTISPANSLVGSTAGDMVGSGLLALSNGNYVVRSEDWDYGQNHNVGAVAWGDGTAGVVGPVSPANSLVGSTDYDYVGIVVTALSNGNYVVASYQWDNGAVTDAGAATWANGGTGISGVVSAANSLVGSQASDHVSVFGATALSNGDFVVPSAYWDNGPVVDSGAVTWASGLTGIAGPIVADNSVLGAAEGGGWSMCWAYDYVNDQLVVGRPADNTVTLFRPFHRLFLPLVVKGAP